MRAIEPGAVLRRPVEEVWASLPYSEIWLERDGCFGTCPLFELRLGPEGRAEYVGSPFSGRRGTFSAKLDVLEFARLCQIADFAGLRDMERNDAAPVAGRATAIVRVVTRDGEEIVVVDDGQQGPAGLFALRWAIEGLASALDWKVASGGAAAGKAADELVLSSEHRSTEALPYELRLQRSGEVEFLEDARSLERSRYEDAASVFDALEASAATLDGALGGALGGVVRHWDEGSGVHPHFGRWHVRTVLDGSEREWTLSRFPSTRTGHAERLFDALLGLERTVLAAR